MKTLHFLCPHHILTMKETWALYHDIRHLTLRILRHPTPRRSRRHSHCPSHRDLEVETYAMNNNTCKYIYICTQINYIKIGRRPTARGRRTGSGSRSQRTSTLPWTTTDPVADVALPQLSFTQDGSAVLPLPSNPQPVDFFRHLFDDRVLKYIVEETNR